MGGVSHVGVMLEGGGKQTWVTCNGGELHCDHCTLITPFTITATYHPPPPATPTTHKHPKRLVSTISALAQMKWIIGISQQRRRYKRERI